MRRITMMYSPDQVILHYQCPECKDTAEQSVSSLTVVGIDICPNCGHDMDIMEVEVVED